MRLWRKPYTLRRFQKKKIKRGYATSGYSDIQVELDVQPFSAKELEVLPEGERSMKHIKTFGDHPIQTADQKAGVKADRLFYEGRWYECTSSEPWTATPLGHYSSKFTEVPEGQTEASAKTEETAAEGGGDK